MGPPPGSFRLLKLSLVSLSLSVSFSLSFSPSPSRAPLLYKNYDDVFPPPRPRVRVSNRRANTSYTTRRTCGLRERVKRACNVCIFTHIYMYIYMCRYVYVRVYAHGAHAGR